MEGINHHRQDGGEREEDQPHHQKLSGAYIRGLVKQLTSSSSSSSKTDHNNKEQHQPKGKTSTDGCMGVQNLSISTKFEGEETSATTISTHNHHHPRRQQQQQQQQQQKVKQVRRRLHTSRPYQERLLNMAEARREIVTALKFHRAAMKQAADKHHHQQHHDHQNQQSQSQSQPLVLQDQDQAAGIMINSPYSSSSFDYFSNYTANDFSTSYSAPYLAYYPPPPPLETDLHHLPNYSPYPPPPPPPPDSETLFNLQALPDQTLGLNLNFHDFNLNMVDSTNRLYNDRNTNSYNAPVDYSYSSASSSSLISTAHNNGLEAAAENDKKGSAGAGDAIAAAGAGGGGGRGGIWHAAMDEEEMAEIRSIGEQHQMEWDDALDLATSAWWFKFFTNNNNSSHDDDNDYGDGEDEDHHRDGGGDDDDDVGHYYSAMLHGCTEFPTWYGPNQQQQHPPTVPRYVVSQLSRFSVL